MATPSTTSATGWPRSRWHFLLTGSLAIALWPALRSTGLSLRFDWTIFQTYWIGLTLQSIFLGVLLCAIGMPFDQGIGPWWRRIQRQKMRLVLLAPLLGLFLLLFGPWKGLLFFVDAVALVEFVGRSQTASVRENTFAVLLPATYFFAGLITVFGYNDVIAALRFDGTADQLLNRMDMWLLGGASVSSIAQHTLAHLPAATPSWLSLVYFGMFPQLGFVVLLLGLQQGAERAFRFVGTILVAYYIGLICFYLLPATGPYFLSHSASTGSAAVYASEKAIAAQLNGIHARSATLVVGADYFIALPCLHLVQPLIVLWYLRRWKRIAIALATYDCVLIAAILLLEQHYVVDLIAGVMVAAAAIALASPGAESFVRVSGGPKTA
jgi:hypothetical protein